MANRFGLPDLGVGVGLRVPHFGHVTSGAALGVDWFEIVSENYLDPEGWPLRVLDQVAERYPVVLHGVGLNLLGTEGPDPDYLRRLKDLADRVL